MLTELVYKNRFFIFGTVRELRERLAEHSHRYSTVKELLDNMCPEHF